MTRLRWRCRRCPAAGHDTPGLATYWAHWRAWHGPRSIWEGTR